MTTPIENERLARIETIVGGLDKKLDDFIDNAKDTDLDHETRIRALEKTKWLLAGGAAILGAVGRELLAVLQGG